MHPIGRIANAFNELLYLIGDLVIGAAAVVGIAVTLAGLGMIAYALLRFIF
jgi:hypothetical protein